MKTSTTQPGERGHQLPSSLGTVMRFSLVRLGLVALLSFPLATVDAEDRPQNWLSENYEYATELYRWLHQNPELSLEEKETSQRLAMEWRAFGFDVTEGVGGYGIVGILKNKTGDTLLLRTDLDALPVTEQTPLPFRSRKPGVMHACGHDVHMVNLTLVGKYLAENRDLWRGTLMLIGQPAEERGTGALAMLEDGLFRRFPKPSFGIALHVDSYTAPGTVQLIAGPTTANSDSVKIVVKGRGGHGSEPHTTIDPVVQAADLIMSLQTIVSREVDIRKGAVITVGKIEGGTKNNIISDECRLELTVRSFDDDVRSQLKKLIRQRALGIAAAYGAPTPEVEFDEGVPALVNDKPLNARLRSLFEELLGPENVGDFQRTMGFEDFAYYGREGVPIVMYALGSVAEDRLKRLGELGALPSLHSADYYPDFEPTLRTGFTTMSSATITLLAPH